MICSQLYGWAINAYQDRQEILGKGTCHCSLPFSSHAALSIEPHQIAIGHREVTTPSVSGDGPVVAGTLPGIAESKAAPADKIISSRVRCADGTAASRERHANAPATRERNSILSSSTGTSQCAHLRGGSARAGSGFLRLRGGGQTGDAMVLVESAGLTAA